MLKAKKARFFKTIFRFLGIVPHFLIKMETKIFVSKGEVPKSDIQEKIRS